MQRLLLRRNLAVVCLSIKRVDALYVKKKKKNVLKEEEGVIAKAIWLPYITIPRLFLPPLLKCFDNKLSSGKLAA